MTRNTLRRYLYGLVVASLPACCHDTPGEKFSRPVDAAIFDDFDGGVMTGAPLPPALCHQLCDPKASCSVGPLDGGTAQVECAIPPGTYCAGPVLAAGGRPPAGLRPAAIACRDPLGAYWAYMAHIEGAAVHGFLQLARELERLGAPAALIDAAHQSAGDERRHARIARRLARQRGAAVPVVEIDPTPPRSAFQIALDNATEGGVFETYGVLITAWQSHMAADRRVRAAFCRIREDELRHAELAEAVARWLEPRLSPGERAAIAEARREAAARLAEVVARPAGEALTAGAGLPPPEVARAWVANLTARLWS